MTPRRRVHRRCIKYVRNSFILLFSFFIVIIYKGQAKLRSNIERKLPSYVRKYVMFQEEERKPQNVSDIRHLVQSYNKNQTIRNLDVYGLVKKDTLIMVINVHKLTTNLKYMIESLSRARGIEDALIIFSHTYYDENLNQLISLIDFCRVMQIFYPHSVQMYPKEFPGLDPSDCPHSMSQSQARKTRCRGADHPDIRGNFRDPESAERKHHWWWTANTVFENLSAIQKHEGLFIFFEDDLYFLEDFVYMTLFMKKAAADSECDLISLGAAATMLHYDYESMYQSDVLTWDPNQHADVLAFNLTVWNSIAAHYDLFCGIDDDSWARSLYHLSLNRKDGKRFKVISTMLPRAAKLCVKPLYIKILGHDWISTMLELSHIQTKYEDYFYPPHLEIYTLIELETDDLYDFAESRGGWADPRDVGLCKNMTVSKIKKILLDTKTQFTEYEETTYDDDIEFIWRPSGSTSPP